MANYKLQYTGPQIDNLLGRVSGAENAAAAAMEVAQGAAGALPDKADKTYVDAQDTALDGRLDAAETNITALNGRLDATEADITALEAGKADASDVYTKDQLYTQQEAVRKFAYLEAALGNSIQILDTIASVLAELEIRGETTVRRVVFSGGNTVDMINGGIWPFANGVALTFANLDSAVAGNNKTATVTTVSGPRMTFPASTFTNGVSLNRTVTDGTTTVYITVSPDHPQTLTSLHSFDLSVSGKNLLKYPYADTTRTVSGVTFTDNGDGSITINGTASADIYFDFVRSSSPLLVKNGTYALSGGVSSNLRVVFAKTPGSIIKGSDTGSGATFICTTDENLYGFIQILSGATISNVRVYPQIEKGSVKSTWEQYQGITVTVPLRDTLGNDLYAQGIVATRDVAGNPLTWAARDYVFKDTDGKWKLYSDSKELVLNGAETWLASATITAGEYRFYTTINDIQKATSVSVKGILISDKYQNTSADYNYLAFEGIAVDAAQTRIFLYDEDCKTMTAAQFKIWLASHQVTIIYKLASPTTTELHADCQAALNAAAVSFEGVTNISLSTAIGQVYAKAAKNITKVIDDIKAAIALLG